LNATPAGTPPVDLPQNLWGKILSSTPVVMTVVATMLAGLASSEMTRAQYDRSLAAQLQSKAGDQWSFFQAKKLRSALQHSTLDMIAATTELHLFDATALVDELATSPAKTVLESSDGRDALAVLKGGRIPEPPAENAKDPKVAAALDALEKSRPEVELNALLSQVDDQILETTLRAARERALALDAITSPLSHAIDTIELALTQGKSAATSNANGTSRGRDFTAARLRYNAQRYDLEARQNQAIAGIYELQVRKNNTSAERHHKRSGRFFFGMLAAQMAVIMATFAMAARNRSFLWSIAAVAGMAAIAFAVYVYLYV
jgi:hypothetical protein